MLLASVSYLDGLINFTIVLAGCVSGQASSSTTAAAFHHVPTDTNRYGQGDNVVVFRGLFVFVVCLFFLS